MHPVSICRLHHNIVCLFHILRVFYKRSVMISDITRKQYFLCDIFFCHPHFNGWRSKQMSCIYETYFKSWTDFIHTIIITWCKMLHNIRCILHIIHWCDLRLSSTSCFTVSPFRLKLLYMSRILKHYITKIRCRLCSKYSSPETMIIQKR